jgi:hypothetical protein
VITLHASEVLLGAVLWVVWVGEVERKAEFLLVQGTAAVAVVSLAVLLSLFRGVASIQ